MLVSAIMPTCDRRRFIPASLKCYQDQTWKNRELIVVDDGSDSVADLLNGVDGASYYRVPKFKTLGEKVNFCCEKANGEIIATWDDDDWYAPDRLKDQVSRLVLSGKSLSGYHTILFYDGIRASQYRGAPDYATGSSQVYKKSFWVAHKFDAVNVGYDTTFSGRAKRLNQIISSDGSAMLVARIHGENVTGRRGSIGDARQWPWVPNETLPTGFSWL